MERLFPVLFAMVIVFNAGFAIHQVTNLLYPGETRVFELSSTAYEVTVTGEVPQTSVKIRVNFNGNSETQTLELYEPKIINGDYFILDHYGLSNMKRLTVCESLDDCDYCGDGVCSDSEENAEYSWMACPPDCSSKNVCEENGGFCAEYHCPANYDQTDLRCPSGVCCQKEIAPTKVRSGEFIEVFVGKPASFEYENQIYNLVDSYITPDGTSARFTFDVGGAEEVAWSPGNEARIHVFENMVSLEIQGWKTAFISENENVHVSMRFSGKPKICGDGVCGYGETYFKCPVDCEKLPKLAYCPHYEAESFGSTTDMYIKCPSGWEDVSGVLARKDGRTIKLAEGAALVYTPDEASKEPLNFFGGYQKPGEVFSVYVDKWGNGKFRLLSRSETQKGEEFRYSLNIPSGFGTAFTYTGAPLELDVVCEGEYKANWLFDLFGRIWNWIVSLFS